MVKESSNIPVPDTFDLDSRAAAEKHGPRVSVLMLTFNRPQFIGRAIQSVVDQSYQDWELLVVQDGSNQQTIRTVSEWAQRDPRVRHLNRDQTGNIANACNYGIEQARGVYMAVLDDDDYWSDPEKLASQVSFLDSHADYVGCGGGAIVVDEHDLEIMRYLKPTAHADIIRDALCANPMVHSTMVYRRQAALSVAGYDETLSGYQDWDLWLKLGVVGKLYNFPIAMVRYTLWEGGGSYQQQRGNARSAIRIVNRHRRHYRRATLGTIIVYLFYGYTWLPRPVTRITFSFLSRLKKRLFSKPGEKNS